MENGQQFGRSNSTTAPWVLIQKKTFTNWVNEQLKTIDKRVDDLQTDFEDGILLIELMQILLTDNGYPMTRKFNFKRNPKLRVQKMENVAHALHMMSDVGIQMVNVGNEDIEEGNLKLILGMVWRLIQKFQISTGPQPVIEGGGGEILPPKKTHRVPPKKLMMRWINGVLPDDAGRARNFANDWNDGVLLSALLNYCDPELIPDWRTLNRSNKLENCRVAMQVANDRFDIPMVLSPEDLSSDHLDELSGITYISYFLRHEAPGWTATLKWVQEQVPDEDVKGFDDDWNDGFVLCGLIHSVAGECADWRELDRANKQANLQKGLDAGKQLGVEPILKASELARPDVDELAVMAYASGFHKAKRPVDEAIKTSFGAETYTMKQINDYGKCAKIDLTRVSGLQTNHRSGGFMATAETPAILYVRIQDQHVSVEDISAQIESPGSPVPISLKALSTELVEVQFTPIDAGIHKVTVRCRGESVQGSPISVDVEKDMSSYPQNVRMPSNITAIKGEQLTFQVDAVDAGQGDLTVDIRNNNNSIPSRISTDGKVYTVHAVAKEVGIYKVVMKWNNERISDDVMQIEVRDASKVRTSGEGLSRAREDTPAIFTVDPTLAGPGQLRVQMEGPNSMAKVSMDENQDGTYTVTYIPVEVGLFTLKIFWGDRQIPGCPYHIKVTDPRRVRIMENSIKTGKSVSGVYPMVRNEIFKIGFDSREAGPGIMQADLDTPTSRVPLNVEAAMEGRHSVSFIPDELGDHELKVTWSGFTIKESPVRLFSKKEELPVDHTRVRVTGEGRETAKVNRHTEFNIDGSRAGPGVPGVRMSGADCDIDVKLQHLGNHIYSASYMPEKPGTYLLHLTWSDKQVPGSPFKVNVAGESYANRVIASGVELKTLVADQTSRIVIDGRDAGTGELTARCVGPNTQADVMIGDNQDNTYSLLITAKEQGRHVLEVKYGTEHIQGSPFVLRVAGAPDASQVRCFGPGLEHGILSTFKGRFICETKGAGAGQLKVRVHGPRGGFRVEMKRNNNRDRNIDVTYNPTETGEYNIHVKWSDKHVPGSPFTIKIVENEDELRDARRKIPSHSTSSIKRNGEVSSNGWAEEI